MTRHDPARPSTTLRAWRFPVVLLVPALIVAAVIVSQRTVSQTVTDVDTVDPAQLMPVSQRPGVASSTFYCAGGTATGKAEGFAEHTVMVANLSDERRIGKITAYFDKAEPQSRSLEVGAHARVDTRLADVGKADFASAVVEVPGGEVAVEHLVSGPTGRSVSTCASSPSNSWYFPAASTRPGARLILAVFNPFPDSAVVDITFATDDGERRPQAFDGMVVPGGRVIGVEVTGVVTLRPQMSASVVTRQGSGRVVVDQLQSFDGTDVSGPGAIPGGKTGTTRPGTQKAGSKQSPGSSAGGPGTTEEDLSGAGAEPVVKDNKLRALNVSLGAPVPVRAWLFPEGPPLAPGIDERFAVMNPGSEPVAVELQIFQDDRDRTGSIEPYEIELRPGQQVIVSLTQDNRVPPGVGHFTAVTSRGGPVVAARVVTSVALASEDGFSLTIGSPLVATRWLVAAASVEGQVASMITITNPSAGTPAQVTVVSSGAGRSGPIERFDRVELAPGARTVAQVGDADGKRLSVRVESSTPVLVEHRLDLGAGSLSIAQGEPMAGTLGLASATILPSPDSAGSPSASSPLGVQGSPGTAYAGGSTPPGSTGETTVPPGTATTAGGATEPGAQDPSTSEPASTEATPTISGQT